MKQIPGLTDDERRAAELFRALGNPARLRIVAELARERACATGDFVGRLPLAQSTVSQHLKVLKDAGIVRGVLEGGDPCYCLDGETLAWLAEYCRRSAVECC